MNAKHTNGPWHVNGKQSIRGPQGEYIAIADWKNCEANARLIAAAPELLTWLKWSVSYINDDAKKSWQFEQAIAAIAKATGE